MSYQDDLDVNGYTPASLEQTLRSRADVWNFDHQAETAISYTAQGGHVSPEMRMSMGYYQAGKKAAEAAGRDVADPNAPQDDTGKLAAAYRAISQPRPNSF
ncbi:hypothetical protein [Streptomyces zaomyceticus]|uniref:hypothetical protein n=1 Tax=Streptomyces zaomyceticus TaxID=68286 RepID=UPI00378D0A03